MRLGSQSLLLTFVWEPQWRRFPSAFCLTIITSPGAASCRTIINLSWRPYHVRDCDLFDLLINSLPGNEDPTRRLMKDRVALAIGSKISAPMLRRNVAAATSRRLRAMMWFALFPSLSAWLTSAPLRLLFEQRSADRRASDGAVSKKI